ncbi:MAG: 23S rRNA (uracil(1939)-C(5))-methyltransferase RlmD [Candidatus Latescibacterota bacterium]|nr:23S rRNA (uracil(1939)-C(5))-methyltransferase RlmD [Candidatus Latescibacterota bacterium]
MKRGDLMEVEVIEIDYRGDGIGRVQENDIVVRRGLPGDRIEGKIVKKRRGRIELEIVRIISCEIQRIDPQCIHFGICGGCRWQDISYEDQLNLKESLVQKSLERKNLLPKKMESILPSVDVFYYRNKMEFSFGSDRDGVLQLGLHIRGRYNRIFDIEKCHLQSPESNMLVEAFRAGAKLYQLKPYNLKTHDGLLRFLVVREAKAKRQLMINLVVAEYPHSLIDLLIRYVRKRVPQLSDIVVSRHTGKAQVAVGEASFVLKGNGYIQESCGDQKLKISPSSFYQTNSEQAERLYAIIRNWAGKDVGNILDLYSGTGSIALYLSTCAKEVTGVEVVADATIDAVWNAEENAVDNCKFISAPVEDFLKNLDDFNFDLVIIDPPRPGVHPKVLERLGEIGPPRILYVSCNIKTLVENLEMIVGFGYQIERLQPVDMFPQTPHCEIVCELKKLD